MYDAIRILLAQSLKPVPNSNISFYSRILNLTSTGRKKVTMDRLRGLSDGHKFLVTYFNEISYFYTYKSNNTVEKGPIVLMRKEYIYISY